LFLRDGEVKNHQLILIRNPIRTRYRFLLVELLKHIIPNFKTFRFNLTILKDISPITTTATNNRTTFSNVYGKNAGLIKPKLLIAKSKAHKDTDQSNQSKIKFCKLHYRQAAVPPVLTGQMT
jgi:hypothetical protein